MKTSLIKSLSRIAPLSACLLLVAAGCGTLPDVGRFSDATTQLYVTVQTAGDAGVAELAAVDNARPAGSKSDNVAKVAKGWQSATTAAKAVAEYSDSLRTLVESGEQGKANAQKAVQSVDTLVKTVAIAYPGGEAGAAMAEGIFDGLATLYGAVAREVAARKLAKEIQNADPFIQKVGDGLAKQFLGLGQILQSSKKTLLFQVEDKYSTEKQRLNLQEGLRNELMMQASTNGQLTTNASLLDRWQWADKMVQSEREQPWHHAYIADQAAVTTRLDAKLAVVQKAAGVIRAWAASHKDLVTAVQEKRSPNFAVLMALSQDLLETYEQTKTKVEQIKSQSPQK